jgi:hypothetical protein
MDGEISNMESYANRASKPLHRNVKDGAALLAEIEELLNPHGIRCQGAAKLKAVTGDDGKLSHWEVWFQNASDQPWIGTVSLAGGNKNDGLGLEAMAVPNKRSAAMQRIEAFGNYGTTARPGTVVRLGVRGYSWIEAQLPREGEVELPLSTFTRDTSKMADEYFDRAAVLEKRNEKMGRVQFFEKGKPLNEAVKPKVWRGADALARSTFDPPKVVVEWVDETLDHAPGWKVEIENTLPKKDDRGELCFMATLKIGPRGFDAAALEPKAFTEPEQKHTWFIPQGAKVGEGVAAVGASLVVGTRGLGWFAALPLPEEGGRLETDGDIERWGFREDQYNRRNLTPEFLKQAEGEVERARARRPAEAAPAAVALEADAPDAPKERFPRMRKLFRRNKNDA